MIRLFQYQKPMPRFRFMARILIACTIVLGMSLPAVAQLPLPPSLPDARLGWIFPAGGQLGTTFDVTVRGDDLDDATQLQFDDPGITSVVKLGEPGLGQTGPQPVPGAFTVTIKPEVAPGIYQGRVMGRYGISNPRAFMVGSQPELTETEPNNSLKQATAVPLGTTINGVSDGAVLDYFKFSARQGQRVIIDCRAFRIDSRLDGTLVLYNSAGKELDRSRNQNRRDPMLDFTVPADGEYVIALFDHVYGYYTVQGECFYRLTINTAPYLDFIFPPAGLPGSQGQYTVYGRNLPGGKPAPGMRIGGQVLDMLTVNIALPADKAQEIGKGLLVESSESFMDGISYRMNSPQGFSNPVLLSMAGAPVVAEQEPNNNPAQAPLLKLPCEYVGQFYPRGDRDWVLFEAKQGEVLSIEVFSQRLGLSTDPSLLVQQVKLDAQGVEQALDLASVDDEIGNSADVHWSFLGGIMYSTATHDPRYRFVAPETGKYRVLVRDLARTAQDRPQAVYRLSIRPPQPDFRLVAVPRPPTNAPLEGSQRTVWSPLLRRGGAELIEVYAYRRDGFDGEIQVTVENLPAGVTSAPVIIAPGMISTTLVLHAADDAPTSMALAKVTGKARVGAVEVIRTARSASMIWADQLTGVTYSRSRLTDSLPVAVSALETAPYDLSIAPDLMLETSRLGTVKLPVNVLRRGNFKGSLVLTAHGVPPIPGNPMHAQPKFHLPTEIKADQNSVELTLTVPNPAPVGTYTIFLSGMGTVSYARNPAALKAAQDRKIVVEKIVAEDDARNKAAIEAQGAAEKLRLESETARLKAVEDLKAAEKALATAQANVNEAQTKANSAQAALMQDPVNATLLAAKRIADQLLEEARQKLKAATDAKAINDKAAAVATEKSQAAVTGKLAADKAAAEALAKAKASAAFLQSFGLEVTKLQESSKPTDVQISSPSNRLTLKITSAPVSFDIGVTGVQIKAGTKRELPIAITRLYGYADAVQVNVFPPAGFAGNIPVITVPKGQDKGTLSMDVYPTAKPGTYTFKIQAFVLYNGQYLNIAQEIPVTIEAP
ncbi:MAG: peptidase domain protein [Planctomycetaceae bacterium]|nr:peptidase domain protein [Planctomycetaceae bacterium]